MCEALPMAEWSLQDVVQDMKDNAKLLANRKGKASGGLQQGVLKSILFRLESLHHLDAAGALELHRAVQESSFPEDMQEAIAGKVDQLMGEACEEHEACYTDIAQAAAIEVLLQLPHPDRVGCLDKFGGFLVLEGADHHCTAQEPWVPKLGRIDREACDRYDGMLSGQHSLG